MAAGKCATSISAAALFAKTILREDDDIANLPQRNGAWKIFPLTRRVSLLLHAEEVIVGRQRLAPGGLMGGSEYSWRNDGPDRIEEIGFALDVITMARERGPGETEAVSNNVRARNEWRRERILEHEI